MRIITQVKNTLEMFITVNDLRRYITPGAALREYTSMFLRQCVPTQRNSIK